MARNVGYIALVLATLSGIGAVTIRRGDLLQSVFETQDMVTTISTLFGALAIALAVFGCYRLALAAISTRVENKRRIHDLRNVIRLSFVFVGAVGVLAVLTEQWVGLLVSLGVVGVAITFALQQPLFSLLGWMYIMVERPYGVGDRVKIDGAKGDVIDVGYLVTTLWEIDGDLVSSNQPSGRVVTLPNSVVLSTEVYNFSWQTFPYVWNELAIQVAYETDLQLARTVMIEEAEALLGDEMARNVARYRELLSETPVELEVGDRPQVNIVQRESWIELHLRYLVHPRRGTRIRNRLYEDILDRFSDHPEAIKFPLGRNR